MAVIVVDQVLMWLGGLADDTEGGILNLARQITALRTTAVTAAGRRLGNALRDLRLQYREFQLRRIHWDLLDTQLDLDLALRAGRHYLAQLQAVILPYQPRRCVPLPLAFPGNSAIFDMNGGGVDEDLVQEVLENELAVTNLTSRRLMGHIPQ
jgi:hypothetical protein